MRTARNTLATLVLALGASAEEPFADLAFDDALARAAKEEKIVMVDFFTTWCAPCKKLDATTWRDAGVRAWLAENTVALKIDAEQETELAARYEVRAYPTMVFVKPDGVVMDRIVGFKEADDFLADAKLIASGGQLIDRDREALVGNENDPQARMMLAAACERRGLLDEALEHYLWCWDEGVEHMSAFSGVRVSFLVGYLGRLAKRYEPAREAMLVRRAESARALLGTRSWQEASKRSAEVVALDRELGQPEETLATYDALRKVAPDDPQYELAVTRRMLEPLLDELLARGRDEDALFALGGDPIKWVEKQIDFHREMAEFDAKQGHEEDPAMERMGRSMGVRRMAPALELLVALDRSEDAVCVVDTVLAFDHQRSTFDVLADRAVAGGGAAARPVLDHLMAKAAGTLEQKDLDRLRRRVERAERRAGADDEEPGEDG